MIFLNSKGSEKIKTEEPLEGDKVKIIVDMSPLEGDEEKTVDLLDKPPLEPDEEEVKEEKELKTLNPNKLLTRLPVLLQR